MESKVSLISDNKDPDKVAALIKTCMANWDNDIKIFEYQATMKKAQFDIYIKSGFTESQAMELVK